MLTYLQVATYEELSRKGADIIREVITSKPQCVLGLATGSTPIGIYDNLISDYQAGKVDFSSVVTFNLDEYAGLDGENEQSYRYFMDHHLFNHVNINKEQNTNVPDGMAFDLMVEGICYDTLIESFGGIDLQLLGIGLDGHIGFNEPDDCFTKETHPVTLDESTIEANARFFERKEDVPTMAITMGMGSIMAAKQILLVANGEKKKAILEKALNGPITPRVPASILQLHPNVTVIYSEV